MTICSPLAGVLLCRHEGRGTDDPVPFAPRGVCIYDGASERMIDCYSNRINELTDRQP